MSDSALLDMLVAARAAIRYTGGVTWDEFAADDMRQSAVIQKLTVLGEAAKRVPEDIRAAHPDIPWRKAAGLRDRLVHDYEQIIIEVVWQIATHDLPALVTAIQKLGLEPPA